MKSEIKKIWIEALRSGKYKQGKSYLRSRDSSDGIDTYCCLGVLVDCYLQANPKDGRWAININDSVFYVAGMNSSWDTGYLPQNPKFKQWTGELKHKKEYQLVKLNDDANFNFAQIADWIEENL